MVCRVDELPLDAPVGEPLVVGGRALSEGFGIPSFAVDPSSDLLNSSNGAYVYGGQPLQKIYSSFDDVIANNITAPFGSPLLKQPSISEGIALSDFPKVPAEAAVSVTPLEPSPAVEMISSSPKSSTTSKKRTLDYDPSIPSPAIIYGSSTEASRSSSKDSGGRSSLHEIDEGIFQPQAVMDVASNESRSEGSRDWDPTIHLAAVEETAKQPFVQIYDEGLDEKEKLRLYEKTQEVRR